MTRQITQAGIGLIKSFEARRYVAYRPTPNDVWTIADGHTIGVKEGDTCDDAQADAWLIEDTASAAAEVDSDITAPLTDDEFDALVCLAFNIGRGAFRNSTLRRKLDAGDYQGAAQEFLRWNKQASRELAGLDRRRAAEMALFNTPDQPKPVREKNAMAANSQNTGIVLGVGGSAVDLLNWACTPGVHFPLPDDAKVALVVVGGYLAHVIAEFVTRTFPSKSTNTGQPG